MNITSAFLVLACSAFIGTEPHANRMFILAGEHIRFDAGLRPQFTENQIRNSSEATRAGLAKWAATEHGQKLIALFNVREYEVRITEDPIEEGAGRAPQPGIATLLAAGDHTKLKAYVLILNPGFVEMPKGMIPLAGQPATPADIMSAVWAGEMLHIYFYSQGISLPHHHRADFQREWQAMAAELGMPAIPHDDYQENEGWRLRRAAR